MAERSFKHEVKKLRLGNGDSFQGEGILAITKALLQSGVSYVGGYQGSPISHLMDVLNDAQDVLHELGVHFEANGSEATAAAMLSASINYPLRGAVTWKSTVGTNVASDALSNIASSGVTGGAMAIVGEDYGEGSSIMQERTYAFAMKAQMWLLDPRPDHTKIVTMIEHGFSLSEASKTPIFFMMRVRGCHATGEFIAQDNVSPEFTPENHVTPNREAEKIILPPYVFDQEREKVDDRLPSALRFIVENNLNECFPGECTDLGIITCGGSYNTLIRALERQGLSDVFGNSSIPIYVMNVTYPVVPEEIVSFCLGKTHVLLLEEGQPAYIEPELHAILRKRDIQTKILGKDVFPPAGEYTAQVLLTGLTRFLDVSNNANLKPLLSLDEVEALGSPLETFDQNRLVEVLPARPSGLCTGCPERPLFSAIKQLQTEQGPFHISSDIGCHSFATLAPFNLGNTIMGYGLSLASSSSIRKTLPHKAISIMGDGGFWHNGLSTGVVSAVFNKHDGLLIIVNNGYSAATGGQDIPSMVEPNDLIASTIDAKRLEREDSISIASACRGAGVEWIRTVSTYNIMEMKETIDEALNSPLAGLKVVIAEGECMLNRQRRIKPLMKTSIENGRRTKRARFYIDEKTCTGDHACIRLSGCPSLTIKPNSDTLREHPVSYVDNSCVGCGVCGENAHSAVLCPSFARIDLIYNPNWLDRFTSALRKQALNLFARYDQIIESRSFL